jgi:oligopeptidase B
MIRTVVVALVSLVIASSAVGAPPPIAKKVPYVRDLHGDKFTDDYFWLRKKGDAEVEKYLRAEEAYAEEQLAPLAPLEDTLYTEIVSHIAEDDESVPAKDGKFVYWRKLVKGQQYAQYLRRPSGAKSGGDVVLDLNVLAEGKKYIALGAFDVDDAGNILAYSTDETGFREYTLQFKDLRTGKLLPERIPRMLATAWASDGKSIFYTVEDDAKRAYRVYRHVLNTDPKSDVLVYEEKDERFDVGVMQTQSRAFIVIHSESKLATEVRLIDAKKPDSAPVLVEPREGERKYDVDHDGTQLVIRTNDTGRNFRIVTASVAKPGRADWKELVAHDDAVMIEGVLPLSSKYVVQVRRAGVPELDILDPKTKKREAVAMPEVDHSVRIDENNELAAKVVRYSYQSLSTPRSWFEYDFATKKSKLLKETPVPGGFDRKNYETALLQAKAKDGTSVPISIVVKKGVPRDGTAPLFLNAYGSYGLPFDVTFNATWLPLLDRGVVVAIAHIRGGGEMGKAWHESGRLAHKMNTFTDFIASAEHLVAEKWTSPKRLAIRGGSAGGLLMGAVTNMRPDLFQAVVSDVPFVDVVNTMNDATLPLTVTEYEEWGNPAKKEEYAWLRAYSPYENLAAKAYPALLVRSSYNDSQVMYWEPAKYVARLRALKTDKRPLLFKIHMEPAGHGGKSGRYERYRENAEVYAWVLWQLGLGPTPPL